MGYDTTLTECKETGMVTITVRWRRITLRTIKSRNFALAWQRAGQVIHEHRRQQQGSTS